MRRVVCMVCERCGRVCGSRAEAEKLSVWCLLDEKKNDEPHSLTARFNRLQPSLSFHSHYTPLTTMDALPPQAQAVLQVPAYVAGSILSLTLTRVAFQVRKKGRE